MSVLRSIFAAFAMFSAFPAPKVKWNRENLRWMLCAFPLVGAAVGLLCWGWAVVAECLHLPATPAWGLSQPSICAAGL